MTAARSRSIAGLGRSDHITDTLASFHWLKAPDRVQYKLATIAYRLLNGTAPSYLAADLRRLSDMPSKRSVRSSLTHQLDVRQSQCATVGDRAFATVGARFWNSLPAVCVRHTSTVPPTAEFKTFLQRVSIAYYAERCISHDRFCSTVRPSVRPSVTRWYHAKTTPPTIIRSSLEDSPMTLSFLTVNFSAKLQREHRERGRRMREG